MRLPSARQLTSAAALAAMALSTAAAAPAQTAGQTSQNAAQASQSTSEAARDAAVAASGSLESALLSVSNAADFAALVDASLSVGASGPATSLDDPDIPVNPDFVVPEEPPATSGNAWVGFGVDAVSDVDGDGVGDLLLAQFRDGKVRQVAVTATTGEVIWTSKALSLGSYITTRQVADVDGDGRGDVLLSGIELAYDPGSNACDEDGCYEGYADQYHHNLVVLSTATGEEVLGSRVTSISERRSYQTQTTQPDPLTTQHVDRTRSLTRGALVSLATDLDGDGKLDLLRSQVDGVTETVTTERTSILEESTTERTTREFTTSATLFDVDGDVFTIPEAYADHSVRVLPLKDGVVLMATSGSFTESSCSSSLLAEDACGTDAEPAQVIVERLDADGAAIWTNSIEAESYEIAPGYFVAQRLLDVRDLGDVTGDGTTDLGANFYPGGLQVWDGATGAEHFRLNPRETVIAVLAADDAPMLVTREEVEITPGSTNPNDPVRLELTIRRRVGAAGDIALQTTHEFEFSSNGYGYLTVWGAAHDYDGDGMADLGIYGFGQDASGESFWYEVAESTATGEALADRDFVGGGIDGLNDIDGDSRDEFVRWDTVKDTTRFTVLRSNGKTRWSVSGDRLRVEDGGHDLDGDGKRDLVVSFDDADGVMQIRIIDARTAIEHNAIPTAAFAS